MGVWTDSQLSGRNTLGDLPTGVNPDEPERFSGLVIKPRRARDVQLAGSEWRTASKFGAWIHLITHLKSAKREGHVIALKNLTSLVDP